MPASRPERITFAIGLVAIAILLALLVPALHSYRSATASASDSTVTKTAPRAPRATPPAAPSRPARPTRPPKVTTEAAATTAAVVAPQTRPKPKVKPQPRPKPRVAGTVKVTLTAARGDCWLEIHTSSAKGKILYVGTLSKGKSFVAPAHKLWIRFGAPQNVDLLLARRKVTVPVSSLNAIVTPSGIRSAA